MKKSTMIRGRLLRMALLLAGTLWLPLLLSAQTDWPRTIVGDDGALLYVYQPQPDSFSENVLRFKAAFTYLEKGKEQRYGSFVALTVVDIDKDQRKVGVMLANVLVLAISGPPDSAMMAYLKETLECGIPGAALDIPLDDLVCSLQPFPETEPPGRLKNDAPRIIVAAKPSILVVIDGAPKIKRAAAWGIDRVINTPNIILESFDGWFYLYGGGHWYIGPEATGPYNYTGYIAPDVQKVQLDLNKKTQTVSGHIDTLREGAGIVEDIIVSTSPAELIQTKGNPVFRSIAGTRMQYISNSNNDIFRDSVEHTYYVLLSGRWFRGGGLDGPWSYVAANALPPDLAKTPEGSPKDNILAAIAGTAAAREALMDARLPQTAVISRHSVTPGVPYDGPPKFMDIAGTHLQYAVNTPTVVLKDKDRYYSLEKGVWFFGTRPSGPWTPCTERPAEVELIPPECPVYFCRYVYIYGASEDYIYTGYSAGYLNACIGSPTLVYGTGWHYTAWMDNAYYARPETWGFGMTYNPWFGWCLSEDLYPLWFNPYLSADDAGQWWGAGSYRPPYLWHHFFGHGLYEQDIRRVENISYVNNLYSQRPDHVVRQTAVSLYTDTVGDVFLFRNGAGWMRREDGQWKKLDNPRQAARLDIIVEQRRRSALRQRNFLRQRGS